jgi:predicted nucleotide-binding protein
MLPMPEHSRRIFISYSSEDRDFAKQLGNLLKNRGASVFQDADIVPGRVWADGLRAEIEQSTALILVIPSRNAANRNNVLFEAGAARALGKRVFAVLPPKHAVSSVDLPTDIADLLVLDADRRSLESIADTLLHALPTENAAPSVVP